MSHEAQIGSARERRTMSSVTPDAHDLDDTVARPPRPREPALRPVEDLEKTITVQRRSRSATEPPALVEPPAQAAAPMPTTSAPGATPLVPDVRDNVWSQRLPERPRPFRLRLADGTLVPLDQPVYLGR